jgi:hypothetical protein
MLNQAAMVQHVAERRSLWERRLDRLGDYLTDAASSGPPRTPEHTHHQPLDHPEENQ